MELLNDLLLTPFCKFIGSIMGLLELTKLETHIFSKIIFHTIFNIAEEQILKKDKYKCDIYNKFHTYLMIALYNNFVHESVCVDSRFKLSFLRPISWSLVSGDCYIALTVRYIRDFFFTRF